LQPQITHYWLRSSVGRATDSWALGSNPS